MVVNKPYVHFKTINDIVYEYSDSDYLWATTIEADKGPMFEPTIVQDAEQAYNIFGYDAKPFFANGGRALLIIRVGAQAQDAVADPEHVWSKGSYSIGLAEAFQFQKVVDAHFGDEVATNKVTVDEVQYMAPTYSIDINENTHNAEITHASNITYTYVQDELAGEIPVARNVAGKWQKVKTDGDGNVILVGPADAKTIEFDTTDTTVYPESKVLVKKAIAEYTIAEGTSVIDFVAKYVGNYGISVSCVISPLVGYNITIAEEGKGSLTLRNVTSLQKIVSRITDRDYNVDVSLTRPGELINTATTSRVYLAPTSQADLDEMVSDCIVAFKNPESPANPAAYHFALDNLTHALENGSNGYWEINPNTGKGQIPAQYRADAHKEGLELLEQIRLSGVYCDLDDEFVKAKYIEHAELMNNNETCKWRFLLLGASENQRNLQNLIAEAVALNNQYTLFLGQGLIEKVQGQTPIRKAPFESVQYVAGLRSKLFYGDAIFGGERKKEIQPAYGGTLDIAPLFEYEDSLVWQPEIYIELNESGVLTFTKDYGHISLLDGVTTSQYPNEEDEEGVMSIIKYAQNRVYDVCVGHIGKNINQDTQNALHMAISNVLSEMKNVDQTLIDMYEEGIEAFDVEVVINPRKIQLLGRIYVYLKLTPVHALRQIEVEMTIQ